MTTLTHSRYEDGDDLRSLSLPPLPPPESEAETDVLLLTDSDADGSVLRDALEERPRGDFGYSSEEDLAGDGEDLAGDGDELAEDGGEDLAVDGEELAGPIFGVAGAV